MLEILGETLHPIESGINVFFGKVHTELHTFVLFLCFYIIHIFLKNDRLHLQKILVVTLFAKFLTPVQITFCFN